MGKSVFITFCLWFFGGFAGLHHFYLRRDFHGFIWLTTFGGYLIGWISDPFYIRQYVDECNENPPRKCFEQKFMSRFNVSSFFFMVVLSFSWGSLTLSAIPPRDVLTFVPYKLATLLVPLAVALGVWAAGNAEYHKGSLKWPLVAALIGYVSRYFVYSDYLWLGIMTGLSAIAFDYTAKTPRRRPSKEKLEKGPGFLKRFAVVGTCTLLYTSLWGSYLYFNGIITNADGEEVTIREALESVFSSKMWAEIKQGFEEIYMVAQHRGWYSVLEELVTMLDKDNDQHAYEVLGVGPDVSQQELKEIWRRMSRENHPDKVKDDGLRRKAQEKFMEIQRAYETLSKSKIRRNRRNKNSDNMTE